MNRTVRLKNVIGALLMMGFVGLAVFAFTTYTKQLRKIEQTEVDLETIHHSLTVCESRLSKTEEKSTRLNAENVDFIKRTVLQREHIKEIQRTKEDMGKKIKAISTEKQEVEDKLAEMEQLLHEQGALRKRKENELEENFRGKLNSEKNKFIDEKKILSKQIEAAEMKLENLTRENEILLAELNKSKERLTEFEQGSVAGKLEEYFVELRALHKESENRLKGEISNLERTVKEDKKLIRQNEKTFVEVNREKKRLVKQLKQIEEKLKRETLRFHYNLGLVYDKTQQYKDALVEYKKALEITPDDPDIHYNLAIIYDDHFSDKKRAIGHYQAYLRLSPGAEDADKVSHWILKAQKELEWGK